MFLKQISDPQRFGVAELDSEGKLVEIEEKPERPKSSYAVAGIYMYDHTVFDVIAGLKPSRRGEFEITEVSNHYIRERAIGYHILDGWWTDAGTFESLHQAQVLTRNDRLGKSIEAKKR